MSLDRLGAISEMVAGLLRVKVSVSSSVVRWNPGLVDSGSLWTLVPTVYGKSET